MVEGAFAELVGACTAGGVLTAWALYLDLPPFLIGLLGALPFSAQLVQLPASWITRRLGSRRAALWTIGIGRQCVLPLAALPWLRVPLAEKQAIFLSCTFATSALAVAGNNAWTSWMGDLVPGAVRGRYFGRRTAVCALAATCAALAAGALLDSGRNYGHAGAALCALTLTACAAGAITTWLLRLQHAPRSVVAAPSVPLREALSPVRDAAGRRLLAFQMAWSAAGGVAAAFYPLHMIGNLRMGFARMALYTAADRRLPDGRRATVGSRARLPRRALRPLHLLLRALPLRAALALRLRRAPGRAGIGRGAERHRPGRRLAGHFFTASRALAACHALLLCGGLRGGGRSRRGSGRGGGWLRGAVPSCRVVAPWFAAGDRACALPARRGGDGFSPPSLRCAWWTGPLRRWCGCRARLRPAVRSCRRDLRLPVLRRLLLQHGREPRRGVRRLRGGEAARRALAPPAPPGPADGGQRRGRAAHAAARQASSAAWPWKASSASTSPAASMTLRPTACRAVKPGSRECRRDRKERGIE